MSLDCQLSQPWVWQGENLWEAVHHCCPWHLAPALLSHAPYSARVYVKNAAMIHHTDCALPECQQFKFLIDSKKHITVCHVRCTRCDDNVSGLATRWLYSNYYRIHPLGWHTVESMESCLVNCNYVLCSLQFPLPQKIEFKDWCTCIKFCLKLGKIVTETFEVLNPASGEEIE